MNDHVSAYIASASPAQQAILMSLRNLIKSHVPGASEDFKWGRPVFRAKKNFAYLKAEKAYVTLGFYDATMLDDPQGHLEGSGARMRHVKLRTIADVDVAMLTPWLKVAAGVR